MKIRLAERGDIGAIDTLLRRSYGTLLKKDYPASTLIAVLPSMSRAKPALIASGRYFVATEGGRLLGCGGWSTAIPGAGGTAPGRGNIRHVATDPDAVGRGVGRRVLGAALDQARREGMTWMHCTSTLTAEGFYASLGFTRLRDTTIPLVQGFVFPAVEMQLTF